MFAKGFVVLLILFVDQESWSFKLRRIFFFEKKNLLQKKGGLHVFEISHFFQEVGGKEDIFGGERKVFKIAFSRPTENFKKNIFKNL